MGDAQRLHQSIKSLIMRARTSSVIVRWKAVLCRFHLWPVMDLQKWERCESSSHTKQNLLTVLKTYSCKDLQAILKRFKVNFVVVVVVVVDDVT